MIQVSPFLTVCQKFLQFLAYLIALMLCANLLYIVVHMRVVCKRAQSKTQYLFHGHLLRTAEQFQLNVVHKGILLRWQLFRCTLSSEEAE
jgi:hypothetical protein